MIISFSLNIAKRVHKNDMEHLTVMLPLSLANTVFLPRQTIVMLTIYTFGRYLFTKGYHDKEGAGSSSRIAGSILVNFAHVSTIMISLYIGIMLSRGKLLTLAAKK